MTQPVLNQDPIQIVTWRVLPSGEVEALLRLSERDMALVQDRGARYSIAPSHRERNSFGVLYDMPGLLDGGPVGEAAEMGRDIERMVTARLDVTDEQARALYETQPRPPERCSNTSEANDVRYQCNKIQGHKSPCEMVPTAVWQTGVMGLGVVGTDEPDVEPLPDERL